MITTDGLRDFVSGEGEGWVVSDCHGFAALDVVLYIEMHIRLLF